MAVTPGRDHMEIGLVKRAKTRERALINCLKNLPVIRLGALASPAIKRERARLMRAVWAGLSASFGRLLFSS